CASLCIPVQWCLHVHIGDIPCASLGTSLCMPGHPLCTPVHPCASLPASLMHMAAPPSTLVHPYPLVLQVPSQVLLEGDELRLRCRGALKISKVQFFHEQEELGGGHRKDTRGATELLLGPLQLHHRGRYHCRQEVLLWHETSSPVTVVVQELFSEPVLRLEGPTEPPEGDPLALRCLSTPSPLRPPTQLQHLFYRNGVKVGGPQRSPQLRLPAMELFHSGNYSCEVRTETNSVRKRSALVTVTVRSECEGGREGDKPGPHSPPPPQGPSIPPRVPPTLPQYSLFPLPAPPMLPILPPSAPSTPYSPSQCLPGVPSPAWSSQPPPSSSSHPPPAPPTPGGSPLLSPTGLPPARGCPAPAASQERCRDPRGCWGLPPTPRALWGRGGGGAHRSHFHGIGPKIQLFG
uniref:Ig-like domain-containing protein n=1 Tax=Calidris pygmaea TaxID=425635 RepID=A0A8C3J3X1_9CHAR